MPHSSFAPDVDYETFEDDELILYTACLVGVAHYETFENDEL